MILLNFKYAAADHLHCKVMFNELKTRMLDPATWAGDSEQTISELMGVLQPDIKKMINKLYQPVVDMEAKYLATIDDKISGSEDAKAAISALSTDGIQIIERLILTEGDLFTQSYFESVLGMEVHQPKVSDLKNLLVLPVYSIKTDFLKLCGEGLDMIQQVMDSTRNSMVRIHNVFNAKAAAVSNIPKEYIPVVFPYVQMVLVSDFKDMQGKQEDFEFSQHIESTIYDLQAKLVNDVNKQVRQASSIVSDTIKLSKKLTEDVKKDLMQKLDDIVDNGDKNFNMEKEKSADDLKQALPGNFDVKTDIYWKLLAAVQDICDDYEKEINFWGTEVMSDLVNIFDDLVDVETAVEVTN